MFDIFDITDKIKSFFIEQDLFNYYKMEFLIYLCSTYTKYYNICPENLRFDYFNLMQERLKNHLGHLSDTEIEYANKLPNVGFILHSNFTIFNQFKKKLLG